jgi:hypothetical protein
MNDRTGFISGHPTLLECRGRWRMGTLTPPWAAFYRHSAINAGGILILVQPGPRGKIRYRGSLT